MDIIESELKLGHPQSLVVVMFLDTNLREDRVFLANGFRVLSIMMGKE